MREYTTDFGETIDLEQVDRAFVLEKVNEKGKINGFVLVAFMVGTDEKVIIKAYDNTSHAALATATKDCLEFIMNLPVRPEDIEFIRTTKYK